MVENLLGKEEMGMNICILGTKLLIFLNLVSEMHVRRGFGLFLCPSTLKTQVFTNY